MEVQTYEMSAETAHGAALAFQDMIAAGVFEDEGGSPAILLQAWAEEQGQGVVR